MSVIFQLFRADDLKMLSSVEELEELRKTVTDALKEAQSISASVSEGTPKGTLPHLRLQLTNNLDLPPHAPPEINAALNKRLDEVSEQLKSPAPAHEKFDFTTRFNKNFNLAARPRSSSKKTKEQIISEWAISCEVNNFEFYYPLLYARDKAYDKFITLTHGQRPIGPDSPYSPFNPLHPLYKSFPDYKPK